MMEVKGVEQDAARVARSAQVRRYLRRYGKVLVCTYRDFLILSLDANGDMQLGSGSPWHRMRIRFGLWTRKRPRTRWVMSSSTF
ncbi:hypothetical protein I553_10612 [Mycobacterium xenopi 4042]|uniref:Uncharacterized protein n=1 Tax=Mycobacterium xenopi 4042 TaxID=1299334 RepID=X7ZDU0_MYCXE|nr:hypothetical protein I553_10612 [Mycobacterium xenopi 4042]